MAADASMDFPTTQTVWQATVVTVDLDEVIDTRHWRRRPAEGVPEPGFELVAEEDARAPVPESEVDREIAQLPKVTIVEEKIPDDLALGRFLAAMVSRVLGATPVNMHDEARRRRALPEQG